MAYQIRVELEVTVQNDEQAAAIMKAVDTGLAEIAVRDRVLYGLLSDGDAKVQQRPASKAKATEALKEIRPIIEGGQAVVEVPVSKKERPRGVLGNRRIGRTGRD